MRIYESLDFEVITPSHVPSVVFQVFAKGLLKLSRVVPLNEGAGSFAIIPKFSYAPKAHCIVFFIDSDGEIVSDSVALHFENELPNYVSFFVWK